MHENTHFVFVTKVPIFFVNGYFLKGLQRVTLINVVVIRFATGLFFLNKFFIFFEKGIF